VVNEQVDPVPTKTVIVSDEKESQLVYSKIAKSAVASKI
jgi:hypothetical protein